MKTADAIQVLDQYSADQWGLVTTTQAANAGVDRTTLVRLVDAGLLESPTRGVYLVAASGAPTHLAERAAWLRLDPARPARQRQPLDDSGGVISHRSAAQVHGLGNLPADGVDITVPRRRTTRDPQVRLRIGRLEPQDVTTVDGLPTTGIERTILDLLADHVDAQQVGDVVADAARRHRVNIRLLADHAGRHARKYGLPDQNGEALMASLTSNTEADTETNAALAPKSRYSGAMATIQIRDIPEEDAQILRRRAADAGMSLQAYMRAKVIELARQRTKREVMEELWEALDRDPSPGATHEDTMESLRELRGE